MERLSKDFIQKVKDATDLIDLISDDTDLRKVGNNVWKAHCPNPEHEDSTPSFTVSLNRDGELNWCCYGCHSGKKDTAHQNFGSDSIAYVMWRSRWKGNTPLSFYRAVMYLAERYGVKKENSIYSDVYEENARLARAANSSIPSPVLSYLRERGLTDESIRKYCIGFSYGSDKIPRIIFPLYDCTDNIVGFSKRVLPGETSHTGKYINSRTSDWFKKHTYLYGMNDIDTSFGEIRITEGVMDVIIARQNGVKNIVCTLGTSLTEDHVKKIKQLNLVPVLCMDSDEAGRKATERAVRMFEEQGVHAKVFFVPEDKDICDFCNIEGAESEQHIKMGAIAYWQYILDKEISIFESHINELRIKMLPDFKKAAASIINNDELIIMKSYLKERTGILL